MLRRSSMLMSSGAELSTDAAGKCLVDDVEPTAA